MFTKKTFRDIDIEGKRDFSAGTIVCNADAVGRIAEACVGIVARFTVDGSYDSVGIDLPCNGGDFGLSGR